LSKPIPLPREVLDNDIEIDALKITISFDSRILTSQDIETAITKVLDSKVRKVNVEKIEEMMS
jgi:hypothetical protein